MKFAIRAAALGLSALLLLPAGALAAEADTAPRLTLEQKQEDLDALYGVLKENHPDLFANTPEAEFLAKKAEIEARLDRVSQLEFPFELQSLAALAGDSHTGVTLSGDGGMHFFPMSVTWYEDAWVLTTVDAEHEQVLGRTVTRLNGWTMDEVVERFAAFVSADNDVKLRRQTRQLVYAEEILAYLGLTQPGEALTLTLRDGEGKESTLELKALPAEAFGQAELARLSASIQAKPATGYVKKYYFALPLDEATYYIQYNQCREDPELSMEDFTAQVGAELESGSYRRVLLDLRNNGGGSDGVIMPLLDLLAPRVWDGSLQLYGLIGETTFSSAIINAVMIGEMGGVLAGSPTSGSVDHFGSTGSFTLPNSGARVQCSSKMIALSGLLEAAQGYGVEPLRPDVAVEQTLGDYLEGKDTLVEALLAHPDAYELPDKGDAPLTRGRFLSLLWEDAKARGVDAAAPENEFYDVMPFAYYAPAVDWAAQGGIALGNGEGTFEAARPLDRAEAAVLLCRYADSLGLSAAQADPAPAYTDETSIPAWALDAAHRAVGLGWTEVKAGAFRPDGTLTRLEGEALIDALAAK